MLEILKQRLIEAENAYHKIVIGNGEMSVDIDGFGEVTYNKSNLSKLERYIQNLKMQIRRQERGIGRKVILTQFEH